MCGEKMMKAGSNCAMLGSPPRMRGKASNAFISPYGDRITPAYAGKRERLSDGVAAGGDHPRVCGEKKVMRGAKDKRMGSPPRMRGKDALQSVGYDIGRITPAYAGKSVPSSTKNPGGKDHPRVCGEKCPAGSNTSPITGSPPRMRGKDAFGADKTDWTRITPAYAGKRFPSALPLLP